MLEEEISKLHANQSAEPFANHNFTHESVEFIKRNVEDLFLLFGTKQGTKLVPGTKWYIKKLLREARSLCRVDNAQSLFTKIREEAEEKKRLKEEKQQKYETYMSTAAIGWHPKPREDTTRIPDSHSVGVPSQSQGGSGSNNPSTFEGIYLFLII